MSCISLTSLLAARGLFTGMRLVAGREDRQLFSKASHVFKVKLVRDMFYSI